MDGPVRMQNLITPPLHSTVLLRYGVGYLPNLAKSPTKASQKRLWSLRCLLHSQAEPKNMTLKCTYSSNLKQGAGVLTALLRAG